MRKVYLGIGLAVLLAVGGYAGYRVFGGPQVELVEIEPVEQVAFQDVEEAAEEVIAEEQEEETVPEAPEETIPARFNLAVPFSSQAPTADWAMPYQEACEEISALMVAKYYAGVAGGVLDATATVADIQELVSWQNDFFGYYMDTTAAETVQILDLFFGITGTVVTNPTVEMIQAEIAAGRPVIVPTSGRELPNPYFSGEGPLYHMLVIKGYTEGTFITNDPGTRNGADFVYRHADLMGAVGDWNGGDPANGAKVVIFTDVNSEINQ